MNDLVNELRIAQNLVARLARHVATELDLHYDNLDAKVMAKELADLQQAIQMMTKADMAVATVIPHVLARAGIK